MAGVSDEVSHGALGAGLGMMVGGPVGGLVGLIGGVLVAKLLADQGVPATPQNVSRAQEALSSSPDLAMSLLQSIGVPNDASASFDIGLSEPGGDDGQLRAPSPIFDDAGSIVSRRSGGIGGGVGVAGSGNGSNVAVTSGSGVGGGVGSGVPGIPTPVPVPAATGGATTPSTDDVLAQLLAPKLDAGGGSAVAAGATIPDPIRGDEDQETTVAAVPPPRSGAVKQPDVLQVEPYPNPRSQEVTPYRGGGVPAETDVSISSTKQLPPPSSDTSGAARSATPSLPGSGGSGAAKALPVSEDNVGDVARSIADDLTSNPRAITQETIDAAQALASFYTKRNLKSRIADRAAKRDAWSKKRDNATSARQDRDKREAARQDLRSRNMERKRQRAQ